MKGNALSCKDVAELTNLTVAGPDRKSRFQRPAGDGDESGCKSHLADDDDEHHQRDFNRMLQEHVPIQHHPNGHEKEDGKGVLQRQRICCRPMCIAAFLHHHAGKERPQSETHIENGPGAVCNDDGAAQHRQREEFVGPRQRHFPQKARHHLAAGHEHQHDENCRPNQSGRHFPGHSAQRDVRPLYRLCEGRQANEQHHAHEVFHHEPADGHLTIDFIGHAAKFQSLRHHHR